MLNVKLSTKLIGGFCFGVGALALMSLLAYSGAGKILKNARDVTRNKEVDRILTQSEVDHLVWGSNVVNAVVDPGIKKIQVQFTFRRQDRSSGSWLIRLTGCEKR